MFVAMVISPVVLELAFTFAYIALLVVAAFSAARTPGHKLSRRLKLAVAGGTIVYGALFVYHVYEIVV